MNGPTRSPEEEFAYEEGITPRQGYIILSLIAVISIAGVIIATLPLSW